MKSPGTSSLARLIPRSSLPSRELEFLTRQLATLLKAGLPLDQCLVVLAEQTTRAGAREIFLGVRSSVREGGSFARALSRYPREFSDSYRAVVASGELSGSLPIVLGKLADALKTQNALKAGLLGALAYPVIVSSIAFFIVLGLMAYVVPQVVGVLVAQKQSLPFLTQVLILVSELISSWGRAIAMVVAVTACALAYRYRTKTQFRLRIDRGILKIPLLGPMARLAESARFANMLSIMLFGGVALPTALHHSGQALKNSWLRTQAGQVNSLVKEGAPLGRSLGSTGVFPSLLVQMAMTGEQSGELPQMLAIAAKEFEDALSYRTTLLTAVLEPLLIVTMGGIVLIIVLAVMMPLIEINSLVR